MEDTRKGQVTRTAADIYEEFFLPALFAEWAPRVADAARIGQGQRVLDVACGTGVLAREAARRVGRDDLITGLDRNEGMLAVARRASPRIDWQQGSAEALPFPGAAFDVVVNQFGLMFFNRRVEALREMWRVLRPGGRLAVAVWDRIDRLPGYTAMVALLQRLFGVRIADELRAPFTLGDTEALTSLATAAGIANVEIATATGMARFPSVESWVHTDVKGWTLADLIDDRQYEVLLREARKDLDAFVQADGTVVFPTSAHIMIAANVMKSTGSGQWL